MASTSLFYYSPELGQTIPYELTLCYSISAAETVSPTPMNHATLTTFGAIASQSVIDDFLGTTDEFNYLAFNAQAMGTDSMGIIVNMFGQAKSVHGFNFTSSAAGVVVAGSAGTATATSISVASAAHGLVVGDVILVSAAAGFTTSANVDGTWVVATVPDANTFTFVVSVAPGGGPGTLTYKVIDPAPGKPSFTAPSTLTLVQSIGHPSTALQVGGIENSIVVGANGNIAMKINAPGLSAANTGVMIVRALWFPV